MARTKPSLAHNVGFLTVALTLVLTSAAWTQKTRTAYGAFWSTERGLDTTVMIQNPEPAPYELTLSVYSSNGKILTEQQLELGPVESRTLDLRDFVGGLSGHGHLVLRHPQEIEMLPAHAVISIGTDSWVLDFEDERDRPFVSRSSYGVFPVVDSAQKNICVLTNTGDEPIRGRIRIEATGSVARTVRWELAARHTRMFQLPPPRPSQARADRIPRSESLSRWTKVSVLAEGDSGEAVGLQRAGAALVRGKMLIPVHFQGGVESSSGELAGFFSGRQSEVFLWNRSRRTQPVILAVADAAGIRQSTELTLGGSKSLAVHLQETFGLEDGAHGAVTVTFPPGARLAGSVVNLDPHWTVNALKDTAFETNQAYSLGVRLQPGVGTRFKLFNPNDEAVELCVFLHFGEDGYTYPIKTLGPFGYADIDLLEAREEGLPDEIGRLMPENAEIGQANIVLHERDGYKNLVVMGLLEDRASEQATEFQGCFSCPPILTSIGLSPSSFNEFVGHEKNFSILATYNDNGIKKVENVTLDPHADAYTHNPHVAEVDGEKLIFKNPGGTSLWAEFNDCVEAAGTGEPGSRLACRCIEFQTRHRSASVTTRPTQFTIKLRSFIPANNVAAPTPEALCTHPVLGVVPILFKGDERSFSPTSNKYRSHQQVSVNTSQLADADGLVGSPWSDTGLSQGYAFDAFLNDGRLGPEDDDIITGDCVLLHLERKAPTTGIEASVNRLTEHSVQVGLTGSSALPLLHFSATIDYNFSLILRTEGDRATWTLFYQHDGFPNYELYVNDTPIYQFDHGNKTPASLFFPMEEVGNISGNL